MARLEYDRGADAVYIYLRDVPYAYGRDLDDDRPIDYGTDNAPRGIELLAVSHGVNLDDLPEREESAALLAQHNLKVYA